MVERDKCKNKYGLRGNKLIKRSTTTWIQIFSHFLVMLNSHFTTFLQIIDVENSY